MRFLVVFGEVDAPEVQSYVAALARTGLVKAQVWFEPPEGGAALFEVPSAEDLAALLASSPARDEAAVEVVPLAEGDFPVLYGRMRARTLHTWERLMSARTA